MVPAFIGSLLHYCAKVKAFRHGTSLHAVAFKSGMISDILVSNHVVNMYGKCGKLMNARKLFDEMSEQNLVSWSAMISAYDQSGEHFLAIELFSRLQIVPNEFIYGSVISACAGLRASIEGRQVHAQALKIGYGLVSFVSNALINMYMKCGFCGDALLVYDEVVEPNSVAFNALVSGFVENRQPEKGLEFFNVMLQKGLMPDRFSFVGVLGVCSDLDDLQTGVVLHCLITKVGLDYSNFIGNMLVTMYSKFHLMEEAEKVFRLIEDKDLISWNAFITACSHCRDHRMALKVFKETVSDYGMEIDDFTLAGALAACAGLASIRHGKQIHGHLIRTRMCCDVGVGNALVNMYAKCGSIRNAYDLFSKMVHRNLVSWNTIIAGFGNHGLGKKAIDLFEKMKMIGIKPDSVTFVGLLTACNHSGKVDEGLFYFNSMKEAYGISPDIEHFSCIIDLLGRAGKLSEAEEYLNKFPFGNDVVVLVTMLSACRLHGDVIIGERVARKLLRLQPDITSPFVLMSNLYASDEMWSGVADARKLLKCSGIKKEPGQSLIEVNGTFEKFTMTDFAHLRIEEMKDMLKILNWAVDEISLNNLSCRKVLLSLEGLLMA